MKSALRIPTILLLGSVAAVAVLAYNIWSLCCGRCSAATLLNPGPTGFLLLGTTLVALLAYCLIRWRRRRADRQQLCRCGAFLAADWLFCPECGSPGGR